MEKGIVNRLKIVLAEKQKSSKWLAELLGKDRATVSKWVTNTMQPDARNLLRIAEKIGEAKNERITHSNKLTYIHQQERQHAYS